MTRTPTPSVTPSVALLTMPSSMPMELVARYSKYRSAYSPPAESASLRYDSRSRSVMANRWANSDAEKLILRAYHAGVRRQIFKDQVVSGSFPLAAIGAHGRAFRLFSPQRSGTGRVPAAIHRTQTRCRYLEFTVLGRSSPPMTERSNSCLLRA